MCALRESVRTDLRDRGFNSRCGAHDHQRHPSFTYEEYQWLACRIATCSVLRDSPVGIRNEASGFLHKSLRMVRYVRA